MRPAKAVWFELLTAHDDLTLAVETLAQTGSVELETHSSLRERLSLSDLRGRMEEYNRLERSYHPYWPQADVRPGSVSGSPKRILDSALERLSAWEVAAAPLVARLERLISEHSELRALEAMLAHFKDDTLDFGLLAASGPVLAARLFVLPPGTPIEELPASLLVKRASSASQDFMLAVGRVDDLDSLATEMVARKGRVVNLPTRLHGNRESASQQVKERLSELDREVQAMRDRIDQLAGPHHLAEALGDIGRLEWFLANVDSLPVSENFAWVTGWTSDLTGKRLSSALEQANLKSIINFTVPPERAQPPLVMQNPWWARPFELFAKLLGTPAGDEADPSRLLALLVPLLFGYMFGDVGHGMVLFVTGIVLQKRWPIVRILIANGLAAMVFGVVFGSVFGREDLIPALWVHPIEHPLPVLLVPLAGGVMVLLLGLTLNAVEYCWRGQLRRWLQVEAAVAVLYLSIIASYWMPELLVVSLAALLWYFAGSLISAPGRLWTTLTAAMGSLLENILQLLINTVSFIRVGAFALAHGGLSLAFVIMAEAADSSVVRVLILLLGNLVVIMLEGLVVSIQTTRLVLFEFFIRFLRGSGRVFRPLTAPAHHMAMRRNP
jgi:V/A-type H+-transporting ATPase subunit I